MGKHSPLERIRGRFRTKAAVALLVLLLDVTQAQTVYYSNYSGDGTWGNGANWGDATTANVGTVPATNATLAFSNHVFSGSGGFQLTSAQTVNLGANRTAAALQFDSPFSYTLQGATLTLSRGFQATTITVTNSDPATGHTIQSNVTLGSRLNVTTELNTSLTFAGTMSAGTRTITFTNNGTVTFAGSISGSGTITQNATSKSGTLIISGNSSATYTGALVAQNGTIQLGNSNVLRAATAVTLSSATAVFDLNDHDQSLGGITFTGGTMQSGTGTLTLAGNIVSNAAASTATVTGNLNLGTVARTFTVANGAAPVDLEIAATVVGSGGITKAGTGTLLLSGANAFTGAASLAAGTTIAGSTSALGTGNVSIASGATLALEGGITLASGPISVVGIGFTGSNGAIDNVSDANTLASNVILGGATQIGAETGSQLTVRGNISQSLAGSTLGAGGGGTVVLSGSNTYSGTTTVNAGTMLIAASNNALGNTGAATKTTVASGGALGLQGGVTINNETITINGTGVSGSGALFSAAGQNTVTNQVVLGSASSIAAADGATLVLNGGVSDGGFALGLTSAGSGNVVLTGSSSYTGATTIAGGTLSLSGANGVISGSSGIAVNGGTLRLDNSSANNANRINAKVTLNDGALQYIGSSTITSAETIAVTAGTGANSVHVTAGTGQRADLTISNLIQQNNATIAFFDDAGTLGSGALGSGRVFLTQINTLTTAGNPTTPYALPGWILVGSDFAEYTGSTAVAGNGVRAVKNYDTSGTGLNVNLTTANVLLDATATSAAYNLTRSTDTSITTDGNLKIADLNSGSGSSIATLTGNRTLVLNNGGIVKTAGTNAVLQSTIAGPTAKLQSGVANLSVTTDAGTTLTIEPIIQNQGLTARGLVKAGRGTLILTGTNTYTGTNYLNDGTLQIAKEQNLGAVAADLTFGGSATLAATGTFTTNTGKTITIADNATGIFNVADGQTLTIAGTTLTAGAGSVLSKTNTGSLVISSTNSSFGGSAMVNAGTLELQAASALGSGRTITVVGGVLRLTGDVATTFTNNVVVGGDATIWVDRAATASNLTHTLGTLSIGSQTLTTAGGNGFDLKFGAVTLSGNAVFNTSVVGDDLSLGAISGTGSLTKTGAGNLTLSAAGTYSGRTTVNAGTLYTAANYLPATTALTIGTGATVNTNGGAQIVGSLSGTGNAVLTVGTAALTVGDDSSTLFSGTVTAGTFTKVGTGSLILAGNASNAITTFQVNDGTVVAAKTAGTATGSGTVAVGDGTGAVNSAVLRLDAPDQIGDTSAVTINADGLLALNGNDDTVASIAGSGSINLDTATLTLVGNTSTTFSGAISGTGGLVKFGTGTLTLSGVSTYSGATAINEGIIVMSKAAALGTGDDGVTVANGAALNIQGSITVGDVALAIAGTGPTATGALNNVSGTNSWGGLVALTGAATINSTAGSLTLAGGVDTGGYAATFAGTGNTQITGAIIGAGSVTKMGSGVLTLGATGNTFSGATTINAGTVQFGTNDAGPAASAVNLAASGTTLNLNNYSGTVGSLTGVAGSTVNLSSGSLTAGVDNSSTTVSSTISGAGGSLIKEGTGTMTLNGAVANTFTGGLTVNDGGVVLAKTAGLDAIGTGSLAIGDGSGGANTAYVQLAAANQINDGVSVTIASDGRLDLNNNSERIASLSGAAGASVALGSGTLSTNGNNATTTFGGTLSGTGGLVKEGTGKLTLAATNTFTGATSINGGTLALTASNAISSSASLTISSGAGLTLGTGVSQAVAGLTLTATSSIDLGANATLTVNSGGGSATVGPLTGTGTLAYLNGGTLTLSSTLNFGGLVLGGTGTTTLALNSFNLSLDTLHITGNTVLDFGSTTAARLTVGTLTIDPTATVSVIGWANMTDYFIVQNFSGATLDTRGTAPENRITFQGYSNNSTDWQSWDHEVTPAPEPGTYGALLVGAALGLMGYRRWRLQRVTAI